MTKLPWSSNDCRNIAIVKLSWWKGDAALIYDFFSGQPGTSQIVSYIDLLGVEVGDSVLCKHHCTSIVFEHQNAWHPNTRRHKTLNLPQNQYLLNDVLKCHKVCLCCTTCYALLTQRKPRNTSTTKHNWFTWNWPPVRCFACVVFVGKHQNPTDPLRNVTPSALVHLTNPKLRSAAFRCRNVAAV